MGQNEFVEWVEQEIKARYWTYNELGRQAGLSSATISSVMTGRRGPGVDFCLGVAKAFNVAPVNVFRKAGILPSTDDDQEFFDEMLHQTRQMRYRDRVKFLRMMKAWASNEGQEEGEEEAD